MSSVADRLNKKLEKKNSKTQDLGSRLSERSSNSGVWNFGNLGKGIWYKVIALKKAKYLGYDQKQYIARLQLTEPGEPVER